MLNSTTEENYIKAIYSLQKKLFGKVSTSALSAKLDLKPASISDKIKKLAEKELIEYQKSKGVQLTEKGEKLALKIIRKHRIWETFLVEKLRFSWDQVHELAEQLEHIDSDELVNRLDSFLNFPKFDPHGDPIPDKNGVLAENVVVSLTEAPFNQTLVFASVAKDNPNLLQLIDRLSLSLGDSLKLLNKEEFDESFYVLHQNKTLHLSKKVAETVQVKVEKEG